MATRKELPATKAKQGVEPPPEVWPFPTWQGQPYTPKKQPRKRRPDPVAGLPPAMI